MMQKEPDRIMRGVMKSVPLTSVSLTFRQCQGTRPLDICPLDILERDKILGVLYGVAYGDGMGMPCEMWTRKQTKERFGWIDSFRPGQEDHMISKGFRPGETTDDTAMTFLVSDLLADSRCDPDPADFVRRVEEWAESTGKSRLVIGPSTRMAFDKIKAGVPVAEAGKNGTTNGASMRISPVGLYMDYRDEERFMDLADRLCMPTHYTNTAISAAAAVAACVSAAVRGAEPAALPDIALRFAELGEKHGNQLCGPSVARRLAYAIELSEKTADDERFLQTLYDVIGTGLPSSESVPSALSIAFRCGRDVIRCGILSANAGGDTDTMGAVSCAVTGALAGKKVFPKSVIDTIEGANSFGFDTAADRILRFTASQR